jgi:signal transduction histidine kinase
LSGSGKWLNPGSASELLMQRAAAPAAAPREAQSLLAGALARLRERTRCEIAVAWSLREGGEPWVAAVSSEVGEPLAPTALEFEAAIRLPQASALLGSDSSPVLRGIAARHDLAAAAPVTTSDGRALAVLLTGRSNGSGARPRELAALTATARRLAVPLAAAEASLQLARLDGDVRRLDRLALLGRMTQELAHEVRNPLVSVKTFLQLLPERRDDPEFTTRFLAVAGEELERTLRLLALVIDYPSAIPSPAVPASVTATLDAVLELLQPYARQRGVSLTAEGAEKLGAVALGEDSLRQVMLNLLLNAIDASPRGGLVKVEAAAVAEGAELVVSDAGPGVAPELRERVFEPFFTTRGTHHGGIGLAIARGLVEEVGGRIQLRVAAGGGAAFAVLLPIAAAGV